MNPGLLLGPKCNHDVGVLLRLPLHAAPAENDGTTSLAEAPGETIEASVKSMLEAMGQHDFYCAAYSAKESPHMNDLLHTLADGLRSKLNDIAKAKDAGEAVTSHETARTVLHRLISSGNRCMHKGFP